MKEVCNNIKCKSYDKRYHGNCSFLVVITTCPTAQISFEGDNPKTKDIDLEMLCPSCKNDMKEYVNRYRCRNLNCRLTVDKYFRIGGSS